LFATALKRNDVPFELHIYQKGKYGPGLNAEFDWEKDYLRWINQTVQKL